MPHIAPGETVIAKYRIVRLLGEGGFGTVYLADQIDFNRQVALKVLTGQALINDEMRARFEREAKILSTLSHPGIVPIYNYGLDESARPYLAMQYIEGKTLRQMITARGKLAWQTVQTIGVQICRALSIAHAGGVVHRDLKPQNIIVSQEPSGQPMAKVLDFGLSTFYADPGGQKLTMTGQLLGSPHYMSPEICRGGKVEAASDIYSLGCILYECVSGRLPFDADNAFGLVYKHASEMPPKLTEDETLKGLPPSLELAIFKAMQKQPEDRFASMEEFARALEMIGSGVEPQLGSVKIFDAPAKPRKPSHVRNVVIAISVALVLGVGVTAYLLKASEQQGKTVQSAPDKALVNIEGMIRSGNYREALPKMLELRKQKLNESDANALVNDFLEVAWIVHRDTVPAKSLGLDVYSQSQPAAEILATLASDLASNGASVYQQYRAKIVSALYREDDLQYNPEFDWSPLTVEESTYLQGLIEQTRGIRGWLSGDWKYALSHQTSATQLFANSNHPGDAVLALQQLEAYKSLAGRPMDPDGSFVQMCSLLPALRLEHDRTGAAAFQILADNYAARKNYKDADALINWVEGINEKCAPGKCDRARYLVARATVGRRQFGQFGQLEHDGANDYREAINLVKDITDNPMAFLVALQSSEGLAEMGHIDEAEAALDLADRLTTEPRIRRERKATIDEHRKWLSGLRPHLR